MNLLKINRTSGTSIKFLVIGKIKATPNISVMNPGRIKSIPPMTMMIFGQILLSYMLDAILPTMFPVNKEVLRFIM